MLSILDTILYGIRRILAGDEELPERPAIRITGDGVTVTDNPADNLTDIVIGASVGAVPTGFLLNTSQGLTGGGALSGSSLTLGFSGINDSQHGSRAGGTLHAVATTSLAGFMSAADKIKLDGLSTAMVASVEYETPILVDDSDPGHPVVRFDPTADVQMGSFSFKSCGGVEFDDGPVLIQAGNGDLSLLASGSVNIASATGTEEHSTGVTLIRTDTFDAATCSELYVASVTLIGSFCTQAASGAGATRRMAAGQGAAGSVGGSFECRVGEGGTPGTDMPGAFDVDLRTAVSGVSAKQRWINAAGGVLGTAGQVAGPVFEIEAGAVCSAGVSLRSSAGKVLVHTADAVLEGYDGDTLGYSLQGASGGQGHLKFAGSSVTSARVEVDQPTGTGSTAGRDLTIRAGDGQNSGGAANAGGDLVMSSGGAGTGTGPVNGNVVLAVDDVAQLTVEGDGSKATFVPRVDAPRYVMVPSYPASSAGALAINLTTSGAPYHTITEATTVSLSGGTEGQHGTIAFRQNDPAYTVTMPSGPIYADDILALTLTGIVEEAVDVYTILSYRILQGGGIFFYHRAIATS